MSEEKKEMKKSSSPAKVPDRRIADETDSRICISDVSGTVVPAVLQSG